MRKEPYQFDQYSSDTDIRWTLCFTCYFVNLLLLSSTHEVYHRNYPFGWYKRRLEYQVLKRDFRKKWRKVTTMHPNFTGSDFPANSAWSRYCLSSLGTEPELGNSCLEIEDLSAFSLAQAGRYLTPRERCRLRLCSKRISLFLFDIAFDTGIGESKCIRLNRGSKR